MRQIVCITCPNGCKLCIDDNGVVTGGRCKRGEEYARAELSCPMRTLTTTVRTAFALMPALPVRTDKEIPKSRIKDAVAALAKIYVDTPVRCGGIVVQNLLELGCNIIATADLQCE